ncbi:MULTISPECIES: hypothetical protein [Bizionia]|uniref:DUF2306 domain-containing protein n=1 Tax=Bizionia algoritergicola TaxID=291187 RepID=A0A5D0QQS7_9FLAO|nr:MULTISPECIES: hypothetical protein [Bizionia]OBX23178.1 hypothetical protein BAA08_05130 [Bizionia sp. APA-3]TYB71553.1 hypothetical protein ES675_13435 [Bizionia algoritergicola]
MEDIIKIAIYIHAFFGGVGLITGIGSIIVKKGSKLHIQMGKLFSIGMVTSSLISIPISWMPNHENVFLFVIGVFTIYLVLAGNRALKFKNKTQADWVDKTISGTMLLFSVFMIAFGIYLITNSNTMSILFLFFGGFGIMLTIKDFLFYNNDDKPKNAWLIAHLGKMNGALIASITAFFIAGIGVNNLIAWLSPTVIGTIYIIYWKRKMTIKTKDKKAVS